MDRNISNFVGGKLKLKIKKKKIQKKKIKEKVDEHNKDIDQYVKNKEEKKKKKKNEKCERNIVNGSGRVVTIKNTVQGFDTKFVDEIKVGDNIILTNPTSLQTENRIVTSILSNRTLLVQEEFSTDISTTCRYSIEKKEISNAENNGNEDDKEKNSYPNGDISQVQYAKVIQQKPKQDVVKIRQKVGLWSYKIIDKKIKGNLTNEEKLDERVKSGRDKFCW
ncbi:conserved Plasmodium protein, unknown function [Plasmodium ovale wallikeri]|uniref:Uncharacterized protein n=1 Tax=Plasmodium ovale wallikeri TaxID=864142 RepID=A0A1A8YKW7_PLAOA|nr:conserved Plasmodium protein, unknown function [Plasmodium ovale wallikeri]SBT32704.1 conserved Plasmodium protein, unknown function [Plasmodium ovale wallikeri]